MPNSPSNLASTDQFGREEELRARGESAPSSCGIGAPLTVKPAPGSAWNAALSAGLLTKSCAQASAAKKDQRLAIEQRRIVEAGAEFGAHVGRVHRMIGKPEAAAGHVALAVGRRVKVLRLHGAIGRDAERRQSRIAVAAFEPRAVALADEVRRELIAQRRAVGVNQ